MDCDWVVSRRYCQNCGRLIVGHKNKSGTFKAECPHCHTCYVTKRVSRRQEQVKVFAPKGDCFEN